MLRLVPVLALELYACWYPRAPAGRLCKRHWFNRVPGAHRGDSLHLPFTLRDEDEHQTLTSIYYSFGVESVPRPATRQRPRHAKPRHSLVCNCAIEQSLHAARDRASRSKANGWGVWALWRRDERQGRPNCTLAALPAAPERHLRRASPIAKAKCRVVPSSPHVLCLAQALQYGRLWTAAPARSLAAFDAERHVAQIRRILAHVLPTVARRLSTCVPHNGPSHVNHHQTRHPAVPRGTCWCPCFGCRRSKSCRPRGAPPGRAGSPPASSALAAGCPPCCCQCPTPTQKPPNPPDRSLRRGPLPVTWALFVGQSWGSISRYCALCHGQPD